MKNMTNASMAKSISLYRRMIRSRECIPIVVHLWFDERVRTLGTPRNNRTQRKTTFCSQKEDSRKSINLRERMNHHPIRIQTWISDTTTVNCRTYTTWNVHEFHKPNVFGCQGVRASPPVTLFSDFGQI
jgi:hypothetical protein